MHLETSSCKDEFLNKILKNPLTLKPTLMQAIEISKKYEIDLHPKYLFYWNEFTPSETIEIIEEISKLNIKEDFTSTLPPKCKSQLGYLGIQYSLKELSIEKTIEKDEGKILVFTKETTQILLTNLGIKIGNIPSSKVIEEQCSKIIKELKKNLSNTTVSILNSQNSLVGIRDKGGTYIGARMGRPEKAKMRKQFNSETKSHGLFPVGEKGGRSKNIVEVFKKAGEVEEEFRIFENEKGEETIYPYDLETKKQNKQKFFEKYTYRELKTEEENCMYFKKDKIDINPYEKELRNILGPTIGYPKHVKGISATINKHHTTEHISKGFLRALNNVYVNKDGTVRYDMIEMGLTHFKAFEIGTSIKKLHELGYTHDYLGKELTKEDQIIEILPQDVILPDCTVSGEELASDFVMNIAKYVDDLLEKFYKMPKFYNFKTKEDTIGHYLIGLAPHTSAGIVGRIIGYSKTQGCFSHPVWHAAQRRNLDGDENGVMLLMDGLINFSREYLPDRRGSRSVTKDTILFIEENKKIKTVKIGEYIDEKFKKGFLNEDDGFETKNCKNLKTFSFNQKTGKVSLENVSKIIRHPCDKKVFEIKTSDGWIKTTQDHSIFSLEFKTGKIIEKKAEELKKGDFIVSLGKTKLNSKTITNVSLKNINIKLDPRAKEIPKKIQLNQSFFRLLGFIYAEGHIRGNKIEIGNTDKKIIDLIVNDIEGLLKYKVNILEDKRAYKYTNGKYYRINLSSNFGKVLKKLGVKEQKSIIKEIPDFVFKTSKTNINSFIEGYCLGDGTSYMKDKKRKMLRLYTASKKLAAGLNLLAFLSGKKSTCRKSKEKRTNSLKYEICISEFKKRSPFWSLYHLRSEINEGLNHSKITKIQKHVLLSNISLNKRLKSSSKDKITKILEALNKSNKNKVIIQKIKNILNQDIRLELVNEVKEIDYKGYVYDLEVPLHQNFLCGPHPIFAHNTMDVSLVLTSHLFLDQVDDEVHGMDIVDHYPLSFYKACKEYKSPKEVKIENVAKRVSEEDLDKKYLGYKFTHDTSDMNNTILCSAYKFVPSMKEKLDLQLELGRKIRSVDEDKVATLVIDKHFMKDIKGNLRKFGQQQFRCTSCNAKYRRPPLIGKCTHCNNPSVRFTISEGSVKKYVQHSFNMIKDFEVDPYLVEVLELTQIRLEGVFGKELEKQKSLNDFFGQGK